MDLLTIALGLAPLLVGVVENYLFTLVGEQWPILFQPILLFPVPCLAAWGYAAYRLMRKGKKLPWIVVGMNLIAVADFLLIAYQEQILHAYWGNIAGALTQFYFLPILTLGSYLGNLVFVKTMIWDYLICLLLMIAATFAGCLAAKKK